MKKNGGVKMDPVDYLLMFYKNGKNFVESVIDDDSNYLTADHTLKDLLRLCEAKRKKYSGMYNGG